MLNRLPLSFLFVTVMSICVTFCNTCYLPCNASNWISGFTSWTRYFCLLCSRILVASVGFAWVDNYV